jgi:hypothetical protein
MEQSKRTPSLHEPTTYEIKVPGQLDVGWADWLGGMTVAVDTQDDGPPVTTLTGALDQAALHGLLRRLYSLGLPLISVISIECGSDNCSCSCHE